MIRMETTTSTVLPTPAISATTAAPATINNRRSKAPRCSAGVMFDAGAGGAGGDGGGGPGRGLEGGQAHRRPARFSTAMVARSRAARSASSTSSWMRSSTATCSANVVSITPSISAQRMRPLRNASTAISLAPLSQAGALPADSPRFVGQVEAGEGLAIGGLEVESTQRRPVERAVGIGQPVRVGQRVADGQAHVGHGQLGQRGPVGGFHHRVDDRLRVDDTSIRS